MLWSTEHHTASLHTLLQFIPKSGKILCRETAVSVEGHNIDLTLQEGTEYFPEVLLRRRQQG